MLQHASSMDRFHYNGVPLLGNPTINLTIFHVHTQTACLNSNLHFMKMISEKGKIFLNNLSQLLVCFLIYNLMILVFVF